MIRAIFLDKDKIQNPRLNESRIYLVANDNTFLRLYIEDLVLDPLNDFDNLDFIVRQNGIEIK